MQKIPPDHEDPKKHIVNRDFWPVTIVYHPIASEGGCGPLHCSPLIIETSDLVPVMHFKIHYFSQTRSDLEVLGRHAALNLWLNYYQSGARTTLLFPLLFLFPKFLWMLHRSFSKYPTPSALIFSFHIPSSPFSVSPSPSLPLFLYVSVSLSLSLPKPSLPLAVLSKEMMVNLPSVGVGSGWV